MNTIQSAFASGCAVASLLVSGYVTGLHGSDSACEPIGQLTDAAWTAAGVSSSTSASEHVAEANTRLLSYEAGQWVDLG